MNLRILACIAMGVFTTYIGVVMLISAAHRKPRIDPPLPRNFGSVATVIVDEKTGEKVVEREFTVTTKLLDPKTVAESK